MINKSLQEITLADLRQLLSEGVGESKTLEYKQELPGSGDGGQVRILRSISSLANTAGGDLLYGVAADEGIPTGLPGINIASQDEVLLRLESLCRDGLSPRLPHIEFHFVPINAVKAVLVVRVKRSWSAPHRVIAGGHSHFYGRNSAGAYPLDVGELRSAFNLSESVAERIRAFRVGRMLAVEDNEGPVRLLEGAKLILHLIPLSAFVSSEQPISFQRHQQLLLQLYPMGAVGWDSKYSLEGRVAFTGGGGKPAKAYTLAYRSGIVEAVAVMPKRDDEAYIFPAYEKEVVIAAERFLKTMIDIGLEPPFYVQLSFVGVRGYSMYLRFNSPDPIAKNSLGVPEVILGSSALPLQQELKGAFDAVANAFGLQGSINYDMEGNWVERR